MPCARWGLMNASRGNRSLETIRYRMPLRGIYIPRGDSRGKVREGETRRRGFRARGSTGTRRVRPVKDATGVRLSQSLVAGSSDILMEVWTWYISSVVEEIGSESRPTEGLKVGRGRSRLTRTLSRTKYEEKRAGRERQRRGDEPPKCS